MAGHPVQVDELWKRSLAGDGEAFGVLFDQHADRVYWHACRLAESREDAQDITAAAFLELWRRREDVRLVEGSILPWLVVTTSNVARNLKRSNRRYRQFLATLPRDPAVPDAADVALDGWGIGVDAELKAALQALDMLDRQLFALIALEDLPIQDAADLLKVTPAAAKARYHRTRHRLRAVLQADEGTSDAPVTTGGAP